MAELLQRLCKKPSLGRVTCGKPLWVWLFYWVPAFETVQETLARLRYMRNIQPPTP